MAAGIVVSIPFWNQSLWHGPFVDAFPQLGDLSFVVGFIVAAGVYYALGARSATQAAAVAAPA
jgi:NCS1 family nucleobase:cation symporter-1